VRKDSSVTRRDPSPPEINLEPMKLDPEAHPASANPSAHPCPPSRNGIPINGVRVDARTSSGLLATLETFVSCGRAHVVNFLAVDPIARAQTDASYRAVLNDAELNLADGLPVAWAARSLHQPTDRMSGTDSFEAIARWGLDDGLGHYLYGGGTLAEVTQLTERLGSLFPGISIVGSESPPFRELTDDDLDEAADRIRAAGTQALWIGLGTPKQHIVGQELRRRGAAPMIFCVGAAFDFVAGTKKRAPAWMQRSGLEWTYRLASEPRRLWKRYLIGNPTFVAGYVADRVSGAHRRARSSSPTRGEG
jgi:N-acetylglucosaminyldiphosphoundecaprenol N-acetyl-beta-D-mannosaminyltransferase